MLHLRKTISPRRFPPRRLLWGLMKMPPWLKTRSSGALVATTPGRGTAILNNRGQLARWHCQNCRGSLRKSSSPHISKYLFNSAWAEEVSISPFFRLRKSPEKSFGTFCGGSCCWSSPSSSELLTAGMSSRGMVFSSPTI